MCKLMSFTNLKGQSVATVNKLTKVVAKAMNSTERDGFGVTLNTSKGLYARRFLKPLEANIVDPIPKPVPFLKINKNEVGTLGNNIKSAIFHGRTSTNDSTLLNTHPIVKHGLWLSHNGVVEDSGPTYKMLTTNDTEHMVERMSQGLKAIETYITGYYATMHYKQGSNAIHILKDNIAWLYSAELLELGGYVFATTESLIVDVCKTMGFKIGPVGELKNNIYFEVDGLSILNMSNITPKGRSAYSDNLASKSLGRKLDAVTIPDYYARDTYELTQDEMVEEFLYEIEQDADSSWSFQYLGRSITLDEFFVLEAAEQLDCVVVRSDGTICSPDKMNGLLYEGKVS